MGMKTLETIDIMPRMLKSAEGRKLVQESQERLDDAMRYVVQVTFQDIDEIEYGDAELRSEAIQRIREAFGAWSKAGGDFAFTLGGINPETRKPYNFPADEVRPRLSDMDRLQIVGAALMPTAWPQMTAQEQATYIERWRPIYDAVLMSDVEGL